MGNPAEETCCHPNKPNLRHLPGFCQLSLGDLWTTKTHHGMCNGFDCTIRNQTGNMMRENAMRDAEMCGSESSSHLARVSTGFTAHSAIESRAGFRTMIR